MINNIEINGHMKFEDVCRCFAFFYVSNYESVINDVTNKNWCLYKLSKRIDSKRSGIDKQN